MNTDQLVSAENIAYKINDNKLFHNISFFLRKARHYISADQMDLGNLL